MLRDKSSTADKLLRGCLRLDVVDELTGASKRQMGFFGLFDPKRRSMRESVLEASMFVLAMIMFICLLILIIYAFVSLQFAEKLLTGPEVEDNWWDYLNIILLVMGLAWPSYLRSRDARLTFANQGSFSSRVVVSLNCLAFTDEADVNDDGIPGLFYMRTLAEQGLDGFFPDEFSRHVLEVAKMRLMKRGRELFADKEANKKKNPTTTGVDSRNKDSMIKEPKSRSRVQSRTRINPSLEGDNDNEGAVSVEIIEDENSPSSNSQKNEHGSHHLSISHHSMFNTLPSLSQFADRLVAGQVDYDTPQEIPSLRGFKSLEDIFYFNPVMQVAKVHKTAYLGLLDHIRNNISILTTPGHLRQDACLPTIQEEYVFAVLCEDFKKKSEVNAKLRVALVRKTTLETIGRMAKKGQTPDWDVVRSWNGGLDGNQLNYFKKRWVTLVHLYDQFNEIEKQPVSVECDGLRRLMSSVTLTFPVMEAQACDNSDNSNAKKSSSRRKSKKGVDRSDIRSSSVCKSSGRNSKPKRKHRGIVLLPRTIREPIEEQDN